MPENVIKRDGSKEPFNPYKIKNAMNKAYDRQGISLNEKVLSQVIVNLPDVEDISVNTIHKVVDFTLRYFGYDHVADTYNQYVNYKTEFVTLFEDLHNKAKTVINFGDRENANFESSLISTQQSIIRRMLTKELYQRNYLDNDIKLAFDEGYLYGHDASDLLFGGINCCLFDIGEVLSGGFEMANLKYKEPTGVLSALQLIGDITLAASAQQYGGQLVKATH